jgi:hypothetical protein
VADLLRAEGVDCRRRGNDQRAREEGGELTHRPCACTTGETNTAAERALVADRERDGVSGIFETATSAAAASVTRFSALRPRALQT